MDSIAPQSRIAVPAEAKSGQAWADSKDAAVTGAPAFKTLSVRGVLLGGIAVLFLCLCFNYSVNLAATRIYQVDECQNIFVARILATGQIGEAYSTLSLFHLSLAWLARNAINSVDFFASGRLFSLSIFWGNLILIALATGQRLLSFGGLVALVGACTLAPLWDYGFEVRNDSLLLSGLLLLWCVVRMGKGRIQEYVMAGALVTVIQFTSFKAFVYTAPLAVLFLLFPPSSNIVPRWKFALAWVGGVLGMFVLFRVAYGAAGLWELYLSNFRRVAMDATGDNRFAPWSTLARLLTQTPLLLALLFTALICVFADLRRRGRAALNWDNTLPEAALFLVALAALLINPTPFPYNLLNLVPFAYLLCFRFAAKHWNELWDTKAVRPLLVTLLIFAHFVPFVIATRRHSDWPNFRQERLIQMAESLTDPVKDPVYDGIGMVPTRRSIHFQWLLHSLNLASYGTESVPHVRDMLASQPAAVIIPSYRTDWLPDADHEYIRAHYVPLGDDFWVLGTKLPRGGGIFEIVHPGRYQISQFKQSNILGTYPEGLGEAMKAAATKKEEALFVGTLDGVAVSNRPVELIVGTHRVESARDDEVAVVWVGPKLDKVPQVGRGDHRQLFVNWY